MGPFEGNGVGVLPPMPGSQDSETSSSDEEDEDQQEEEGNEESLSDEGESLAKEDIDSIAEGTEDETDAKIQRVFEAESELDEIHEELEEESLAKMRDEVRVELSESKSGAELDAAVDEEMDTYEEKKTRKASKLQDEISILQDELDYAGVSLPELYKHKEQQAPGNCKTEVWRNTQWVGSPAPLEAIKRVQEAEQELKSQRPVKNRHGKVIEEGASGYLAKRFKDVRDSQGSVSPEISWSIVQDTKGPLSGSLMGTDKWAPVYLASTPEDVARLGLGLPGQDKIEEIGDLDELGDPLFAVALQSERERGLNPGVNLRKVKEEDDIRKTNPHRATGHKFGGSGRCRNISSRKSANVVTNGVVLDSKKRSADTAIVLRESSPASKRPRLLIDMNGVAHIEDEIDEDQVGWCESAETRACSVDRENVSLDQHKAVRKKRTRLVIDSDDEVTEVEEYVCEADARQLSFSTTASKMVMVSSNDLVVPSMSLVKVPDKLPVESTGPPNSLSVEGDNRIAVDHSESPGALGGLRFDQSGKFACTGCGNAIERLEVQKHPILPVGICEVCFQRYHSGPFTKGQDGSESECRWCGDGGSIVCCESCDKVFCESCISRNFGEDELKRILKADWECFMCNQEPLKILTQSLVDILSPVKVSRKIRKRRRNIKRISDYAERTKELHALEKERQERQERWRDNDARGASARKVGQVDESEPGPNKSAGDLVGEGSIINRSRPEDEQVVHISRSISKHLRPHQLEGVRFMWENCIESIQTVRSGSTGQGCILAHSMGLGKTLQVITFLHTVLKTVTWSIRTALIVVPINVLHNWRNEFRRWQPWAEEDSPVSVHMIEEPVRNEVRLQVLRKWHDQGGVMLIGYSSFRNLLVGKSREESVRAEFGRFLQKPGPDILVCDEAHMIKNEKAEITKALKNVKTRRRIALTGSPLQNNLMEYYCMVDFVREDFLESPMGFRNRFVNPIENGQLFDSTAADVRLMKQRAHILHRRLEGFVQRVDMSVLKNELPPKCAFIIYVRLSPVQRRLYNTFLKHYGFQGPADAATTLQSPAVSGNTLFHAYHALSKIWNHPDLLWLAKEAQEPNELKGSKVAVDEFEDSDPENTEDKLNSENKTRSLQRQSSRRASDYFREEGDSVWWKDEYPSDSRGAGDISGKVVILLDLLRLFSARGDKALVFSQSLRTLDLIEKHLEKMPRESGGSWRKGTEWYRFDGSTPGAMRQDFVDRFNERSNSSARCMLISTRAGSLGINLPAANRVIIVDSAWNPTHDLQALFRVWRFGQTKPVYAYRLCACGTMEEKIYKRQVFKESVAARVLDKIEVGRLFHGQDLVELFRLDDENDGYEEETKTVTTTVPASSMVMGSFSTGLPASELVKDDVMQSLYVAHYPRWIVRHLEHEPLLVDMVDEKLSPDEEALAWEMYNNPPQAANQTQQISQIQQPGTVETPQAFPRSQLQPSAVSQVPPLQRPSPRPLLHMSPQLRPSPRPPLHQSPLPLPVLSPLARMQSSLRAKLQVSSTQQQLQGSPRGQLQSSPLSSPLSSPRVQVQPSPGPAQLHVSPQVQHQESSPSPVLQPCSQPEQLAAGLVPRSEASAIARPQPLPQEQQKKQPSAQLQQWLQERAVDVTPSQPLHGSSLKLNDEEQKVQSVPNGKAMQDPVCSNLEHTKFFRHIGLRVGDKVMCDTCKQRIGWEAVRVPILRSD